MLRETNSAWSCLSGRKLHVGLPDETKWKLILFEQFRLALSSSPHTNAFAIRNEIWTKDLFTFLPPRDSSRSLTEHNPPTALWCFFLFSFVIRRPEASENVSRSLRRPSFVSFSCTLLRAKLLRLMHSDFSQRAQKEFYMERLLLGSLKRKISPEQISCPENKKVSALFMSQTFLLSHDVVSRNSKSSGFEM